MLLGKIVVLTEHLEFKVLREDNLKKKKGKKRFKKQACYHTEGMLQNIKPGCLGDFFFR